MTLLLLLRHATNDSITSGILPGRLPGVHLNEEGRAQAEALADRLAKVELAAVYASPLERAQETAQPLASRHGLAIQIHPSLNETDIGRWAGQPLDRLRRRRLWRALERCPSRTRFPGGESMVEIQARMVGALEAIAASNDGKMVAVVSHADPIKTAIAFYVGLHLDLFDRLQVFPASLSVLALHGPVPSLVRLNDTSHLLSAKDRQEV